MKKRMTVYSTDGVLEQVTDSNAFEVDLEAIRARHPEANMIGFELVNPEADYRIDVGCVMFPAKEDR